MTEATGNESKNLSDPWAENYSVEREPTTETGGEGPWAQAWSDVKQAVQDKVVEPVAKSVKGPWDNGWGGQRVIAKRQDLPTQFDTVFNRLIGQESGGKHTDATGNLITSGKGAKGITQVMPNTGDDPGFGVDPIKAPTRDEYLRFGRDYLKAMVKEFDGDYEKALAAYNAGVGNVKKAITRGGENWKDYLPKKSETLPYIENILRNK